MADIKGGAIRPEVELLHDITRYIVSGQVASDGLQYSTAATFGTTATDIVNIVVDPGVHLSLQELKVNFIHKFTNVLDAVGSFSYQWSAQSEWHDEMGSLHVSGYANLSAALTDSLGSLATKSGTLAGYINIGSIPKVPVRLRLQATGLVADSMTGQIVNTSFVQMKGIIIPGA